MAEYYVAKPNTTVQNVKQTFALYHVSKSITKDFPVKMLPPLTITTRTLHRRLVGLVAEVINGIIRKLNPFEKEASAIGRQKKFSKFLSKLLSFRSIRKDFFENILENDTDR